MNNIKNSIGGGVQFDRSRRSSKKDELMKIKDFNKFRFHGRFSYEKNDKGL